MSVGSSSGPACQRAGALDDVFQFAHVARPVKLHQLVAALRRNAIELLLRFLGQPRQKKVHQVGNVFLVLAQRRNIDGHDVQPVVKVLAKGALLERRAQIAIGGGDQRARPL